MKIEKCASLNNACNVIFDATTYEDDLAYMFEMLDLCSRSFNSVFLYPNFELTYGDLRSIISWLDDYQNVVLAEIQLSSGIDSQEVVSFLEAVFSRSYFDFGRLLSSKFYNNLDEKCMDILGRNMSKMKSLSVASLDKCNFASTDIAEFFGSIANSKTLKEFRSTWCYFR